MRKLLLILGVGALLAATPTPVAWAQDCPTSATVGNFDVTYESAVYDGESTEFTYCVTGLDVPGFHALSHWDLELDADCADGDTIVSCGPEPCFYQVDDPTTGITGIKWDDLEVDKGETECFNLALEGDWTDLIDDVTIGLKAATEVSYGAVCGPRCRDCVAVVEILTPDTDPTLNIVIQHNRPPTIIEGLTLTFTNEAGAKRNVTIGPFDMTYGSELRLRRRIADIAPFPPGTYTVTVSMEKMSGWFAKSVQFVIPAN